MNTFPYYAPEFRIEINDEPIPAELRAAVTGVRYDDGIDAADRVELDLADPDGYLVQKHIRGLGARPFVTGVRLGQVPGAGALTAVSVAPEGLFDMDNKLTLGIGYAPGGPVDMFEGEITGVEADFPGSGMPTLRVVAHDYLNRMSQGKYVRGFSFLPDAIIAGILGAEDRLVPMIDPTIIAASTTLAALDAIFSGTGRKQKKQTNLELLKEIAETYDATYWVEGDSLYVARILPEYSPRLTLAWGSSLFSFRPRVSTVGQVAGVSIKFTLREIPLAFMVTVAYDFDREAVVISVLPGEAGQLKAVSGALVDGPLLSLDRKAIGSPADIAHSALALAHKLRTVLNNRMTGEGSTVGNPEIRAGAVIRIEGVGPDFSGDYRVAEATHTVGAGGYRTDFKVRKEILP
jgi:phage protein D